VRIDLACDHAGIESKNAVLAHLKSLGHEVVNLGTDTADSVDYPDFADLVARRLESTATAEVTPLLKEAGVLICGSGQGMCMRANKYPHIRAALVWNREIAKLSREHNDANVICLGARQHSIADALSFVDLFLATPFSGGRHQNRVTKISASLH